MFRQPDILIARVMQVVGLGIVLALYFAPLKTDYFSVQNRLGFLVEIAPLYFVGSMYNLLLSLFVKLISNSAKQHRRVSYRKRRLLPRLRRSHLWC